MTIFEVIDVIKSLNSKKSTPIKDLIADINLWQSEIKNISAISFTITMSKARITWPFKLFSDAEIIYQALVDSGCSVLPEDGWIIKDGVDVRDKKCDKS